MLTVFVIEGDRPSNVEKLKESFGDLPVTFFVVQQVKQINAFQKETDWYMVLFDNEYLDKKLLNVLPTFMAQDNLRLLLIQKKFWDAEGNTAVDESPRMFRKDVVLEDNSTMPEDRFSFNPDNMTRILDGWIFDDRSAL